MYGIVFLLGMSLFRRDGKNITLYALMLTLFGGALALYHSYLQLGYVGEVTCSIHSTVSCTDSYFIEYGYITIPVIALTSFGMIGISLWLAKKYE
jgi:disulfide bond formation protein DsbB